MSVRSVVLLGVALGSAAFVARTGITGARGRASERGAAGIDTVEIQVRLDSAAPFADVRWQRELAPAKHAPSPEWYAPFVRGLAVSGDSVFAVDQREHELVVLSARTGEVVARSGGFGQGSGRLWRPVAVAVDSGRAWVADAGNARLVGFSRFSTSVRTLELSASPRALIGDGSRIFALTDRGLGRGRWVVSELDLRTSTLMRVEWIPALDQFTSLAYGQHEEWALSATGRSLAVFAKDGGVRVFRFARAPLSNIPDRPARGDAPGRLRVGQIAAVTGVPGRWWVEIAGFVVCLDTRANAIAGFWRVPSLGDDGSTLNPLNSIDGGFVGVTMLTGHLARYEASCAR
jgi:hypothetical protein